MISSRYEHCSSNNFTEACYIVYSFTMYRWFIQSYPDTGESHSSNVPRIRNRNRLWWWWSCAWPGKLERRRRRPRLRRRCPLVCEVVDSAVILRQTDICSWRHLRGLQEEGRGRPIHVAAARHVTDHRSRWWKFMWQRLITSRAACSWKRGQIYYMTPL